MKTTIFKYKEYIGIMSDPNAEGFLAKPENGSFGCVLDASKIDISKEALKTLIEIPRGRDGLGDIDCFKADDGTIVFGWIGGYYKAFKPNDVVTSRDYNPKLLTSTENVDIPEDFKSFIDSL